MQRHKTLEISVPSGTRRWWTGSGDLILNGELYEGTFANHPDGTPSQMMDIGAPEQTVGDVGKRCVFAISLTSESIRRILSLDLGPIQCKVQWIYETPTGYSISDDFVGELSEPEINDGIYSATIETPLGDVDRGRLGLWSHTQQQALDPTDLGFENAQSIATEGILFVWE